MRRTTTGTLLVLCAATGFGTIGIFGEVAATVGLPLSTLLPFRFAVATAAVFGVAVVGRWSLPATRRAWVATFGLGVVYTLLTLAYFTSLRYLTAGLATIVLYTYPAFVVALSALLLRETVHARTVVAVGCSLTGVGLVVGLDLFGSGSVVVAPVGIVLALVAAGCYAVYTVASRHVVATTSPRPLVVGVLVGMTVSMAVYGVAAGGIAVPADGRDWGIVVGLAIVGTAVPLVCFAEGVERLEASRVGVVSTVEPVVTVSLGAVLLDEPVTPGLVLGGALVLGGVVLVQRTRDATGPRAELDVSADGDP